MNGDLIDSEVLVAIRRFENGTAWAYPRSSDGYFSPDEKYPEYPFQHISSTPNPVYRAIRQLLHDLGLDRENFGKAKWNPLQKWIRPGHRVFCLVNFVTHRLSLPWESMRNFFGRTTHVSVIRAVLDYVILASGDPGNVAFGNAPLESADFRKLELNTGADKIRDFYLRSTGVDVGPYDLRLFVSNVNMFGALLDYKILDSKDGISFDLGEKSLLDKFGEDCRLFRIGDYDHRNINSYHGRNRHVYVLHKKILEADHILSIPVLKTHEKVGVTCAIKGSVGAIGRKECLAHHRRGGPLHGGDEFDRSTGLREKWSIWNDRICQRGTSLLDNTYRVPLKILRKALRLGAKGIMEGAWYGNDTCWRMALDINRCILYGKTDGTWSAHPIRVHSAIVDGIVGGEGDGPIHSRARPAGIVIGSSDARCSDFACALSMGFDPSRIPIIHNSLNKELFPGFSYDSNDIVCLWNGKRIDAKSVIGLNSPMFRPPKGWRGKIESCSST